MIPARGRGSGPPNSSQGGPLPAAHRAPVGWTSGVRRGPCGARYYVLAAVIAEVAA